MTTLALKWNVALPFGMTRQFKANKLELRSNLNKLKVTGDCYCVDLIHTVVTCSRSLVRTVLCSGCSKEK